MTVVDEKQKGWLLPTERASVSAHSSLGAPLGQLLQMLYMDGRGLNACQTRRSINRYRK